MAILVRCARRRDKVILATIHTLGTLSVFAMLMAAAASVSWVLHHVRLVVR